MVIHITMFWCECVQVAEFKIWISTFFVTYGANVSPKLNSKFDLWHVVPKIELKIWILTCCPQIWIQNLNFDMLSPKLNSKSEFWQCCPQEAPRRYPEGTRGSIWEASGPVGASGSIWELLEASDLIFAVKLKEKYKSSINMSILLCVLEVWFHICCKNEGKTLPGSVDGAPLLPRPLIQHRENPYR